jgi:hypothetical protein
MYLGHSKASGQTAMTLVVNVYNEFLNTAPDRVPVIKKKRAPDCEPTSGQKQTNSLADKDELDFGEFPAIFRRACRVARFFVTQYTKTGENIPNYYNITKWPLNIPNGRKIFQMTIKYTNIFHSKALQDLPKLGFLV